MFKEISDERPVDGILNQILEHIQNGSLKPGDALPAERALAEMTGVSRPAVREALRALSLLGIVTSVRGGANYIAENLENCLIQPLSILFQLNNSSVLHTQQLRSALERETAVLAAQNCTPLDAAELQVIIARLDAAEDEKVRGDLDRELHMKIGNMAGNPLIYSALCASAQLTENIITGIRAYIMQKNQSAKDVDEQHHRLVEAITSRDEKKAEQCMQEHMRTIENYILEIASLTKI